MAVTAAPRVAPPVVLALVLALMAGWTLASSTLTAWNVAHPPGTSSASVGITQISSFTLSNDGVGPTASSFAWTQSNDSCFGYYTLQYASGSASGPWTTIATIDNVTITSYLARDLTPAATYWWHLIDTDCFFVSHVSNTLEFAQVAAATLTAADVMLGSALLSWTNNARYGGQSIFLLYQLYGSVDGGPWSLVANITSASTMTYNASGLAPGREYAYFLTTSDGCACGGPPILSNSNSVSFRTPLKTSVSLTAQPATADVGQSITFTCTVPGIGVFDFYWMYGDGSSENVTRDGDDTRNHTYSVVGLIVVACGVNDAIWITYVGTGFATVVVSSALSVNLAASGSSLDVGQTVTLWASPSGGSGGFTYTWAGLQMGCADMAPANLSCTPTAAGTYDMSVTVADSNGGTASDSIILVVHPAPRVVLDATPAAVLLGRFVVLTATASGGSGGYAFRWSGLPSGCSGMQDSVILNCEPSTPGTYNVTIEVTDSNGGIARSSVVVTVNPSFLGMPEAAGYAFVAGLAAAVAAVAVALWWSRRKRRSLPPPGPPSI